MSQSGIVSVGADWIQIAGILHADTPENRRLKRLYLDGKVPICGNYYGGRPARAIEREVHDTSEGSRWVPLR